jgi:bifunctional DNA-binding transcriptional regulator/antitoxin component of YhaV-PrlF toxin-antitoxin module
MGIAGQGVVVEILLRVDMTQAQRRYAPSYKSGMVIVPERDYERAGLKRGEVCKVIEAGTGNHLILQKPDGTRATINPRTATQLSVYSMERAELSVGDVVRINRNDAARDLTNGDRLRVTSVSFGLVTLETIGGKPGEISRQVTLSAARPLHLEHAYASTTHGSQGLTTERVFIDLNTQSRTTSMNLYYVAISRPQYEARIYTDSVERLPAAIAKRYDKTAALEIVREREAHRQSLKLGRSAVADVNLTLQATSPVERKLQQQRDTPADGNLGAGL